MLLVDDEAPHCELVRRAFRSRSPAATIHSVETIDEARSYLAREQPDIVLADYNLHDGRGTELLPGNGKQLPYPVVILTGQGDERVAVQAMKDGAHDYVVKSAVTLNDMPHIAERTVRGWHLLRQREQTERALRDSEERLRELMASAHVLCCEIDPASMQFTFVGGNTADTLGYPLESWYERDFYQNCVHPDDREWVFAYLREMVASETHFAFNHRMLASDGRIVWLHNDVQVVKSPGGRPALRGFLVDITEKALADKERMELKERLQQSQKLESLGILASGVAHDFNNLLMGILAYTELTALELPPGSEAARNLAEVQRAAEHAGDLCRQMLAYAGRGTFVVKSFNLSELVSEMLRLLRVAVPKGIELDCRLCETLPEMQGDVSQIRQIVMNLVTNAADAIGNHPGVISIRTAMVRADAKLLQTLYVDDDLPEGDYIVLEVADDGCGMNEETLARLFDPFFTTKATGRGLGLASVLGFVRSHGGGISVTSRPGEGSRLLVLFSPDARGAAEWLNPASSG